MTAARVVRDLKYCACAPGACAAGRKHELDLFLPLGPADDVPLVVFLHGGGWQRGDRSAARFFVSLRDVNLLMALVTGVVFDCYANVGRSFARSGVACAVVSYRLSHLAFPWAILESFLSFVASAAVLLLLGAPLLPLLAATAAPMPPAGWLLLLLAAAAAAYTCGRADWRARAAALALAAGAGGAWLLLAAAPADRLLALRLAAGAALPVALWQLAMRWRLTRRPEQSAAHPEQLSDVLDAVCWAVQRAPQRHGVDASRIVLAGHSAGGHLASLVALDPSHLAARGLDAAAVVRGLIGISGVYDLSDLSAYWKRKWYLEPTFASHHVHSASPLRHVSPRAPPALFLVSGREMGLEEHAAAIVRELEAAGAEATLHTVPGRSHFSIVGHIQDGAEPDGPRDEVMALVDGFLQSVLYG